MAVFVFPRKRNVSGSWGCRRAGQNTALTGRKFYPPTATEHWETPSRCPVPSTSWRGSRRHWQKEVHRTVFEAYITNLGKYAEGQLVGETLKFPATTEEVQSLLKNIGVDGVRYEEFFITAFDGDVMGLYDYLTEYENLDELNHLAHLISELDSDEIETLEAVLNKGDHTSSVADIINLVHNLDCYELHPGVTDDETLGRI